MPKKGTTLPKKVFGDINDPNGFAAFRERYLEWMGVHNYSDKSQESRELYINYFIRWCEERGLTQPCEITKQIIERYQRYLYHYRKENGEPLSFQSQHSRLGALRAYFKYLSKQNYILYNPAADIELPKLEKRLPKHILTIEEVETVLDVPDTTTATGIRDRAILEVFYSTGIRRMELINLRLYDLDRERGTLMVRLGKGKKDRMVPIGQRAIDWCDKYLMETRPELYTGMDDETLFLTHFGEAFTPARMSQLVRTLINKSEVEKTGSCHLFRHTMATVMLENGADIRYLQEMLGHAKIDTTQIYTQVSIRKLKEIHTATHPAKSRKEDDESEDEEDDGKLVTGDKDASDEP